MCGNGRTAAGLGKDRWSAPLFIAVALGFCVICGYVLLDVRRADWATAKLNTSNLVTALEQDIARNIELYIYALRGVADNAAEPAIATLDERVRKIVLFDRMSAARYVGDMMVINEHGDVVESQSPAAGRFNHSDRDYFFAHQRDPYRGPFVSRLNVDYTGQYVIGISRRINHSDGSFAGVVVGMMQLQYIVDLFGKLNLESQQHRHAAACRRHGARPRALSGMTSAATSATQICSGMFKIEPRGSFESRSVVDGVTRVFAYTQVGDYPLVLAAGISTEELEARLAPGGCRWSAAWRSCCSRSRSCC